MEGLNVLNLDLSLSNTSFGINTWLAAMSCSYVKNAVTRPVHP